MKECQPVEISCFCLSGPAEVFDGQQMLVFLGWAFIPHWGKEKSGSWNPGVSFIHLSRGNEKKQSRSIAMERYKQNCCSTLWSLMQPVIEVKPTGSDWLWFPRLWVLWESLHCWNTFSLIKGSGALIPDTQVTDRHTCPRSSRERYLRR